MFFSNNSIPIFRYAEVLLNYAEAQNEAKQGPDDSVHDAINAVRDRAGLPDLPEDLDYTGMKQRIIQERKVELAFEGHRFWDVRRWKKGAEFFKNVDVADFKLNGNGNLILNRVTKTRQWNEKYNLYPIPQSEIQKNGNLKQNPNW